MSSTSPSTPYAVLGRLLREVLGVPPGADAAGVADVLTARVSANAPQLVPWLPLLGLALDVELPATRETRELDEEFRWPGSGRW